MKELRNITDAEEYFRELIGVKEQYLICVAVRDTFHKISVETAKIFMDLGMEDLSSKGEYPNSWQGYLFVMKHGKVLLNKLADIHMSLIEQMEIDGISLQLVSKPYYSGDRGSVFLGGCDLSVNSRGLNVVVFDTQNRKLIDSVCFDFYPDKNTKSCSRLREFLNICLPRSIDWKKKKKTYLDIDAKLDNIIEKYRLNEYYPRYLYKNKGKQAIKELAGTWKSDESIACVIAYKNRNKGEQDKEYFLSNVSEFQRKQISWVFVKFTDADRKDTENLSNDCLDYKVLRERKWQSYNRIYIVSNLGRNYLGLWFRKQKIDYTDFYKFLELYGVIDVDTGSSYYDFIADGRENNFSRNDYEAPPNYWAIYEEKKNFK